MCEKILLCLLLVRFERCLEDILESRLGGSRSCGWRCGRGGHDERWKEWVVSAGQRAYTASGLQARDRPRASMTIDAHARLPCERCCANRLRLVKVQRKVRNGLQ